MKLLLDTHIWLWSALQPQNLSRRITRELANEENELWLSPVSVWELIFLYRKGRVKTPQDIPDWVPRSLAELRITEAPLTIEVALALLAFDLPHGDPADHFLVATAKVFDLNLVTADRNLVHAPGISVLAN